MENLAKINDKDRIMNENKNKSEEINRMSVFEESKVTEDVIRNVEDETSEVIEEMIEDIENESVETIEEVNEVENETFELVEDVTEEIEDEASEDVEELKEDIPLPAKAKKHAKALHLVEKARRIVKEANERTDECKLLLETDLREYQEAKSALRDGGFDACVYSVKKLGYQSTNDEPTEEPTVVFEPKEQLKPMVLKDVSSGKFTGFIYALVGGFATAIGLVYLATEKLGITLNVTKVPSEDVMQSILAWFSTVLGLHENVFIGAGVLGGAVLIVMILIYLIRISLKARSNLHFAVKQFVEAEMYTEQKANCKSEMDKVDAHIKDTIATLKTYEVLFNEQQGKLQRILYFEGEKEKSTDYHDKSFFEIRETKELIRTIKDFMDMPMSEEGQLSEKSILFLQKAKEQIDKILERLY